MIKINNYEDAAVEFNSLETGDYFLRGMRNSKNNDPNEIIGLNRSKLFRKCGSFDDTSGTEKFVNACFLMLLPEVEDGIILSAEISVTGIPIHEKVFKVNIEKFSPGIIEIELSGDFI